MYCLYVIAFLCLVFHMALNSRNAKLKTYGVHWSSLNIQIAFHVSLKASNVLCFLKAFEI